MATLPAKHRQVIAFAGKLLDPLADKLLISRRPDLLIELNKTPAWMAFIILAREMASGLGFASEEGITIAADSMGKWETGRPDHRHFLPLSLAPCWTAGCISGPVWRSSASGAWPRSSGRPAQPSPGVCLWGLGQIIMWIAPILAIWRRALLPRLRRKVGDRILKGNEPTYGR